MEPFDALDPGEGERESAVMQCERGHHQCLRAASGLVGLR